MLRLFAERLQTREENIHLDFFLVGGKIYSANNYHYGGIRFAITRFIFACEGEQKNRNLA